MTTKHPPAGRRRQPAPRPGHRDHKTLLTLGALCAVLGGWLALARETPASALTVGQSGAGTVPVPALVSPQGVDPAGSALVPGPAAIPVVPRPITRTRSSR